MRAILLQASDAPSGMEYVAELSGPVALEEHADEDVLRRNAFRAGHSAVFVSAGLSEAGPQLPSDAAGVGSLALLFEEAEGASDYLRFLQEGESQQPGFEIVPGPGYGEESLDFKFEGTEMWAGRSGVSYSWRIGNLLLSLSALGAIEADAVLALAEKMDSRAQAASG